jgi:hypothetical protein
MFTLDQIVPWGRSFDEYRAMFALSDGDLRSTMLGCADGPASFNAGAAARGCRVVSCDPLYGFEADAIRARIDATYDVVMEQTRRNVDEFVWSGVANVEELGRIRMQAMQTFLADYDAGKREGRYVDAELPALPFAKTMFDLAVCSHFLFLYTDQLTEAFHLASIRELCRVAREVRVFPLVALGSVPSRHVEPVVTQLKRLDYSVAVERVPYEFQRGANAMMRIRPPAGAAGTASA